MTSPIRILDEHSANQIAAGEVVERPVSVIKELVENALDAGATHIDITVEGNGVPLIKVRDNGHGIRSDELSLAVLRHATSKIQKIEDLNDLRTLGFRGEALPSIASISKMEISTRTKENEAGTFLLLEGGKQIEKRVIGCPVGTTITVTDLFYNTPARKKFLRSNNTEFGLISDIIGRLSLARPDVAFSLTHPKQLILKTSGNNNLLECIGAILGNDIARKLIPISITNKAWKLNGFISPPDLVRSTKQGETFIVNSRIIRSGFLSRALREGYDTLVPSKLYPIAILNLETDPSDYDVNVHPTKMDIRFHEEKELGKFISNGIYKTLLSNRPVANLVSSNLGNLNNKNSKFNNSLNCNLDNNVRNDLNYFTNRVIELTKSSEDKRQNNLEQAFFLDQISNPKETKGTYESIIKDCLSDPLVETSLKDSKVQVNENQSSVSETNTLSEVNTLFPTQVAGTNSSFFFSLRPIGQIFNSYILATSEDSLVIIDQHAAHERINYEKIKALANKKNGASQSLLIPIPMEFSLQEEQVLLEQFFMLNEMGFILEQFGPRTYLLRGTPIITGSLAADELLRKFIEQTIQANKPPTYEQVLEDWYYMIACKESLKAKEFLSLFEIEQLLIQLGNTENPYTCPHGRPTIISLGQEELEKRFYRS